jgi:glycerol-1-phosphate dehydrogenase [NAD(P)+]
MIGREQSASADFGVTKEKVFYFQLQRLLLSRLWITLKLQNPMQIHIEPQLLGRIPALLAAAKLQGRVLLVSDSNTWKAAGAALYPALAAQLPVLRAHLEAEVLPSIAVVKRLIPLAKDADFLLAVGSGTINDLTKYTAHQLSKPYLVVATAASMNGYAAANASLWDDTHKTSFAATPPRAIFADLDVLAAAPAHLTASGVGDMLCRSTVEADCRLAHLLFDQEFPAQAFADFRNYEPQLGNMKSLMRALICGGEWMTKTGSSAVASQGEHMIAHTLETLYPNAVRGVTHGQLVAVASVAMAKYQFGLLNAVPMLQPTETPPTAFAASFGEKWKKEDTDALNEKLQKIWPQLREYITRYCHAPETLEAMLKKANTPTRPDEIGLTQEQFAIAMQSARFSRDRFTFLDLTPKSQGL